MDLLGILLKSDCLADHTKPKLALCWNTKRTSQTLIKWGWNWMIFEVSSKPTYFMVHSMVYQHVTYTQEITQKSTDMTYESPHPHLTPPHLPDSTASLTITAQ